MGTITGRYLQPPWGNVGALVFGMEQKSDCGSESREVLWQREGR